MGFSYLHTVINELNGEIRLALQVGEEPVIGVDWYQPLDSLSRYFVETTARYGSQNVDIYNGKGDRLAEFGVDGVELDFAAGREFSVFGEGRLGYRYRTSDVKVQTGTPPDCQSSTSIPVRSTHVWQSTGSTTSTSRKAAAFFPWSIRLPVRNSAATRISTRRLRAVAALRPSATGTLSVSAGCWRRRSMARLRSRTVNVSVAF